MNRLISSFEKEIKNKIRQKADSYKQEEMLLLRTFKFFDYQGEGQVDFSQFERVMNRLSVTMLSLEELRQVFSHYTSSQNEMASRYGSSKINQKLNYHIFVNKVLGLTRGKSQDLAPRREPVSEYVDSSVMGREQQVRMVGSKEFELALKDLQNGIKRMDMMYILNKLNKRMAATRGQREVHQRAVLEEFMNNGLPRKHQVGLGCPEGLQKGLN